MARIRTVKPELFRHEGLYEAEKTYDLPLRLSYIGLFTSCDREGRFKWRPRELKLDILPYEEVDFNLILNALAEAGFIKKYLVHDVEYGYIPSWNNHQCINNKEKQSVLPVPPEPIRLLTCDEHGVNAYPTRTALVISASSTCMRNERGEGNGKEGKGNNIPKVSNETLSLSSSRSANSEQFVLEIFNYWKTVMNCPRAKLDSRRKSKILAALALGYSVEQFKQAIDGCAITPFNMGKNDQKKRYTDINLIFRDADHIERFIQNAIEIKETSQKNTSVSQIDQTLQGAI